MSLNNVRKAWDLLDLAIRRLNSSPPGQLSDSINLVLNRRTGLEEVLWPLLRGVGEVIGETRYGPFDTASAIWSALYAADPAINKDRPVKFVDADGNPLIASISDVYHYTREGGHGHFKKQLTETVITLTPLGDED